MVEEKKMGSAAPSTAELPQLDLTKQIRRHEVAIAEINNLQTSRSVYQKNGNIYFRTTIEKAKISEQKQLDLAKSKLEELQAT